MKLIALLASVGALTCFSTAAKAEDFSIHLQPGVEVPFTEPQRSVYNFGPMLNIEPMFKLHPNFAIGPAVQATYLSRRADNGQNAGVLWQFGVAARLQGDREATGHYGVDMSPYIEGNFSYARTGELSRPSLGARIGIDMFTDDAHVASWGPWIGYTHVFQMNTSDVGTNPLIPTGLSLDSRDYNSLLAGISFSFDFPVRRLVETKVVTEKVVQYVHVPRHCKACEPQVAQVPETFTQRVYFDWDKSVIRSWEESDKIDDLVAKLSKFPGTTVKVDGHASLDGQHQHNVELAARRTAAVVAYLISHGVDASRITSESFGPDKPFAPNDKQEGRERNRRVEFQVSFQLTPHN